MSTETQPLTVEQRAELETLRATVRHTTTAMVKVGQGLEHALRVADTAGAEAGMAAVRDLMADMPIAQEAAQEERPELLIDPDCRDGKCSSCVGGPCQHPCHTKSEATR